jgi:hypothetical protein
VLRTESQAMTNSYQSTSSLVGVPWMRPATLMAARSVLARLPSHWAPCTVLLGPWLEPLSPSISKASPVKGEWIGMPLT